MKPTELLSLRVASDIRSDQMWLYCVSVWELDGDGDEQGNVSVVDSGRGRGFTEVSVVHPVVLLQCVVSLQLVGQCLPHSLKDI